MNYAEREARALERIGRHWECDVRPFAQNDILDFWCIRDGQMAAVGEYKYRQYYIDDFETTWLRLTKWQHLVVHSTALDLPAFYVVEFLGDVLCFVNVIQLTCPPCRLEVGGRTDRPERGNWDKFQPMVGVPTSLLTRIE